MKIRPLRWLDGRDLHLYPGVLALGLGVGLWHGAGAGLASVGLVLLLIGVFGLPAWKKETKNGPQ